MPKGVYLHKPPSDETRQKLSAIRKGNKYSLGHTHSTATKEKMRLSHIGKHNHSEETRRKISAATRGKKRAPLAPEHRRKISAANKGRAISLEVRLKQSGPNSRLWKGGVSEEHWGLRHAIKGTFNYRQWRSDVFTRDNFTCQECGKRDGTYIHAHHIKHYQRIINQFEITTVEQALDCAELWDINNGVTLCKKCHAELHKRRLA